jgi:hypothetical protein
LIDAYSRDRASLGSPGNKRTEVLPISAGTSFWQKIFDIKRRIDEVGRPTEDHTQRGTQEAK